MSILAHLFPFAQHDQPRITPEQEAQLAHACRLALVQVCLRVDAPLHTATRAGYSVTIGGGSAPTLAVRPSDQFTPIFTFDGELHWTPNMAPITDMSALIGAIDAVTAEVIAELDRQQRVEHAA